MTNLERWKFYCKNIHAPAQFIEAGFYFAISAALERRVWVSSGTNKIYANQYVLLVGPAGVGKGLVSGVVDHVLRANKRPNTEDEPIIRMGPTSGSYQKLVQRMAEKSEIKTYVDENGKSVPYPYASICCILDEFTSFFTEHAGEAVTFFCQVWTGNIPYERDTNARGRLYIKNPCVSMLAGTTPANFQRLSKHDIIGTGLDRRLLIVYAESNEWRQFEIPPHTPEQIAQMEHLIKHVFLLSHVCGPLVYSEAARERLVDWWSHIDKCTVSNHYVLRDYHPNKNALLHKLCIARHMAEGEPGKQLKTPISLEEVEDAIRMLLSYEKLRACAWSETGSNLLYPVAMRVVEWLRIYGAATHNQILSNFFAEATERELNDIMSYLLNSGRAKINSVDPVNLKYEAVTV